MSGFFEELSSASAEQLLNQDPPSQEVIDFLHAKASTDGPDDLHHRIGFGRTEASRGDHNHDGQNSPALFAAGVIPGNADTTVVQLQDRVNQILGLLRGKQAQQ